METSTTVVVDRGAPIILLVASATTASNDVAEHLQAISQLESLRHLVRQVAHDINNLLTGIGGFANLALQSLPEAHAGRADLEEIRTATANAATLIQELRVAGGKPRHVLQVPQLNDLLHSIP